MERLREISNLEDITIDDDALYEIARLSDGGMRDAINFLDQLVAYSNDNITIDDVYKVNGSVSYEELYTLLDDVKNNNKVKLIEFVDYLDESGKILINLLKKCLFFLKMLFCIKMLIFYQVFLLKTIISNWFLINIMIKIYMI